MLQGLFPSACKGRLCPLSFDKLKSLKLKVELGAHFMEVMISLLKYSPNLEFLKLWSDEGLYHAAVKVKLSPVSFYKLKTLQLNVGVDEDFMQVLILLLKFSPNLEVLKLWSDENIGWSENLQLHDPDESIVCLESHLKSIRLTGFKYERNEIELLRFFLKNGRVLEKLTVVADKSEEAEKEVLKFPRTSSNVVLTFLDPKHKPGS